jgi:DDE family transposase
LLHGKERLALEATLALAEELGMLDVPAEQIVDSTPMLGAAATQDTVRLVRSGVKKLIDTVAAADEDAARKLDAGLEFDYARPAEKPDCRWRERSERERMLTRVAEDAERALRAVEQAERPDRGRARRRGAPPPARSSSARTSTSTRTACPAFTAAPARTASCRSTTRKCATAQVTAPALRRLQAARRGDQLAAAAAHRRRGDAGERAGRPAGSGAGRLPARRAPPRASARRHRLRDRAGARRARRTQRRVLAPLPPARARAGRLSKRDFRVDLDAGSVTCPVGEVAEIRTEQSGRRRARFAKAVCNQCPLRDRCVSPARGDRQVLLAPDEAVLIAARQALDDPATAEHLRRTRPRIERLLGLLVYRYGARKARYIGTAKARLQALWAAALVNLNPIGRLLGAESA